VQCLVQELGMALHTTYPKFRYRAPVDLEINISRFFSSLFFMHKLS
jgi:hypothetical protein